jgi:dTDP-4-dehydrorhamnose reductase
VRVLIIGSDTLVGRSLQEILLRRGRHVEALASTECRWKSERQTKKALVRARCEFVVDTRIEAMAEAREPIHELDLNRTLWMAKACQKNSMAFTYLSTARVFTGDITRLYSEDDYPDSDRDLGELLLQAESSIRDHCEHHLILRLGPVFSHRGENILTRMLKQLAAGETLLATNHKRIAPVAASDAARVVSGLLDQFSTGAQAWGIYHYCSADSTTCFEFAEVLLASASQFIELSNGSVELSRPEPPPEPLNFALDCSRLRHTFAIKQNPWRGYIADAVKTYLESQSSPE